MHYQPPCDLLQNRIILVTGATDGIGKEAAITYAQYGTTIVVVLLGRSEDKLRAVADEIHRQGYTFPQWRVRVLDLALATPEDCHAIARQLNGMVPRLDGLLHTAGGLGDIIPMNEQRPEHWLEVMQVNVNGTFFLTQALLPLLLKSDAGSLIFTTSSVGRQGRANWGAYAVSKFATEGMAQVMAEEYKQTTLRVNSINPRGTRTGMRTSAFPTENPDKLKTPKDIMPVYLWLMGDDSRHKTGLSVDAQPRRKTGIAE